MGYRYNFKKNKIEKIGLLYIKMQQNDLHVYINGNIYKHKTQKYPFVPKFLLSNIEYPNEIKMPLLPEKYEIRISKEGYYDWENNIIIKPNLTTFLPHIILFKNNVPLMLSNGDITDANLFDNNNVSFLKDEIATTTLKNFNLYDFSDNKIYESLEKIEYIPSANNKNFLIKEGDKYLIIDSEYKENKIQLSAILESKLINVKWDAENDYKLHAIEEKSGILFEINFISKKRIPLTITKCHDYIVLDNTILTIENNDKYPQIILKLIKGEDKKIIETLPYSNDILFLKNDLNYILVKDNAADILYILDPFADNISKVKSSIHGIKKFDVNSYKDKILYANDFEIWMYDLKEDKKSLITRISSPIKNILWHKNENYIIFSTSTNINIIEISDFSNNNYINFISATDIDEILLDEKGKNLYFTGDIGSQRGLFELVLY
ncbi:MAG: hypothetical protein V1891_04890 [bacterium]